VVRGKQVQHLSAQPPSAPASSWSVHFQLQTRRWAACLFLHLVLYQSKYRGHHPMPALLCVSSLGRGVPTHALPPALQPGHWRFHDGSVCSPKGAGLLFSWRRAHRACSGSENSAKAIPLPWGFPLLSFLVGSRSTLTCTQRPISNGMLASQAMAWRVLRAEPHIQIGV
jgi:hypothetical protein